MQKRLTDTELSLSPATYGDIPFLTEGIAGLARMWKKVDINQERTHNILERAIQLKDTNYIVVRNGEEPAAYGVTVDYYDIVREINASFYRDVLIKDKYRGLGVYSKIYISCINRSVTMGHKTVMGYVREGNKAMEIYTGSGFTIYDLTMYHIDILKGYKGVGFDEVAEKKAQTEEYRQKFSSAVQEPKKGYTLELLHKHTKGMGQYSKYRENIEGFDWVPLLTMDNQRPKDMRSALLKYVYEGKNCQVFLVKKGDEIIGSLSFFTLVCDYKEGKEGWINDFRIKESYVHDAKNIVAELNLCLLDALESTGVICLRWMVAKADSEAIYPTLMEQGFEKSPYNVVSLKI